jgi:hypothetical protein
MQTNLTPARLSTESFADYKVRRAAGQAEVKKHLRGSYFYAMRWYDVPGTMDAETGESEQRGISYRKVADEHQD